MHSGPTDAKIVLVGDTPGEEEIKAGVPFVGTSGQELTRCLAEAGLDRDSLHLTNVFSERPPSNNLDFWMVKKKDLPAGYDLPPYAKGQYLCPSKAPLVQQFQAHLSALQPNLIVALGGTALWALTGLTGITNYRGAIVHSPWGKILPTFHPTAILRAWGSRPILVADLNKARVHAESASYTRPSRRILIQPTIDEVEAFFENYLRNASLISTDVETKGGQITCVGFAPSPDVAVVIPFWDSTQPSGNYWSLADELRAWRIVRRVVSGPVPKLFQNGAYDIQYFLRSGIEVRAAEEDSMIQAHAMYPELPKSLGFLGSIHTDEPAWKLMKRKKADTVKREE